MSKQSSLSKDIEKVNQIPIVSTMLEVICRTTGMGFAAIARVTTERWIACSVRDEIQFGLERGGELEISTTICNEIREHRQPVVIDHVAEDALYANHHTPKQYRFQSYISIPIFLKNGAFFGTLCAIDPKPAQLKNTKTIGMFNLFAELIAFHLHSMDLMEQSNAALVELNRQLTNSMDENRQYNYISHHNLQEPLRKIRIFSDMLMNTTATLPETDKTKDLALKINTSAQRFSMMIKDLSEYSELNDKDILFEEADLNKIIRDVCAQLQPQLTIRQALFSADVLPVIPALPLQMEQLFYHLVHNALKFSKRNITPVIHVSATALSPDHSTHLPALKSGSSYFEIRITDNGIGIDAPQLEKIFDIFSQLSYNEYPGGFGIGLAYCRKIVRNHRGIISAQSEPGKGTTFSIILPAGLPVHH